MRWTVPARGGNRGGRPSWALPAGDGDLERLL